MIDFSKIKSKKEVGKCFDYAILPKQTTEQTIRDCCKEAIKYNCKAFCFSSSYWTPIVAEELKGTKTKVKVAGVKDPRPQNAFCFIQAGAELIGTRAAVEILDAVDDLRKIGLIPAYTGDK